jgi:hypothetical protein
MGLTLLLRSFARLDSFFPAFGLSCSGFLPPILDLVMMGSLVPSRSFACLGLLLSAYGITCLDFSLFVLDFVHMESPLSLKTLA